MEQRAGLPPSASLDFSQRPTGTANQINPFLPYVAFGQGVFIMTAETKLEHFKYDVKITSYFLNLFVRLHEFIM